MSGVVQPGEGTWLGVPRRLWLLTVAVRVCVCLVAAAAAHLVPSYDRCCDDLGWSVAWDGVYFERLVASGVTYEWEQSWAFFPLLPSLVRLLTTAVSVLPVHQVAALVSNVAWLACVWPMYHVSRHVLTRERHACLATALYACHPAGVFLSVMYSESLFSMLSIWGLYFVLVRQRPWWAAMCWSLACWARSNAILWCVFLLGHAASQIPLLPWNVKLRRMPRWVVQWILVALQCVLVLAPFLAYQLWAASLYCDAFRDPPHASWAARLGSRALALVRHVAEGPQTSPRDRAWCRDWPVPSVYKFVQHHYWNNGFLRYWTLQQVPNWILAAPMIALCGYSVAWLWTTRSREHRLSTPMLITWLVYVSVHVTMCVFMMHVQVITRFMCAMVPIVWAAGSLFARPAAEAPSAMQWLIVVYFVGYTAVGSVLHPTFYPWT